MKTLINVSTWRLDSFSPYQCPTDFYYAKVAKKFYDILWFTPLGKDCGEFLSMEMSMSLAHYLEDVVSGFGLWATFTAKHKELYGKYLPFHTIDEENYYTDEVNVEDVRLILWMLLQNSKEETFCNPENPYLCRTADLIYAEMEKQFEQAPINENMTEKVLKEGSFNDFYYIRFLLDRLLKTYLIAPFNDFNRDSVEDNLKGLFSNLKESDFGYIVDSALALNKKTGPLNLCPKEWLAALLAYWGKEEESQWVASIQSLPYNIYHIGSYDAEKLLLKDIKDTEFVIPRNSFKQLPDSTLEENEYIIASLAQYRGTWQTNGMSSWMSNPSAFQAQKESLIPKEGTTELNRKIVESNNGKRLLFFQDYKAFFHWMTGHFKVDKNIQLPPEIKDLKYPAIYVPEEGDMTVMSNGALAIKDAANPYYDRKKAEEESFNYLTSTDMIGDEALHYLIDHHNLPDACINSIHGIERGKQLVQENIDFIARFMRVSNY